MVLSDNISSQTASHKIYHFDAINFIQYFWCVYSLCIAYHFTTINRYEFVLQGSSKYISEPNMLIQHLKDSKRKKKLETNWTVAKEKHFLLILNGKYYEQIRQSGTWTFSIIRIEFAWKNNLKRLSCSKVNLEQWET